MPAKRAKNSKFKSSKRRGAKRPATNRTKKPKAIVRCRPAPVDLVEEAAPGQDVELLELTDWEMELAVLIQAGKSARECADSLAKRDLRVLHPTTISRIKRGEAHAGVMKYVSKLRAERDSECSDLVQQTRKKAVRQLNKMIGAKVDIVDAKSGKTLRSPKTGNPLKRDDYPTQVKAIDVFGRHFPDQAQGGQIGVTTSELDEDARGVQRALYVTIEDLTKRDDWNVDQVEGEEPVAGGRFCGRHKS